MDIADMGTIELLFWGTLFVLFLVAEAATAALISVWFVLGCGVAILASFLDVPFLFQCVLFVVSSFIFFAATRPFIRNLKIPAAPTNADSFVGKQGVVQIRVDNIKAQGRVLVEGLDWSARSTNGQILDIGTLVVVDKLEGVTLFVSQISEESAS